MKITRRQLRRIIYEALQSSPSELEPIFKMMATHDEEYIRQAVELFNSLEGTNVEVMHTNRTQAATSITVEIPANEFTENTDGFSARTATPHIWDLLHPFIITMAQEFERVDIDDRTPDTYTVWINDYAHGSPS